MSKLNKKGFTLVELLAVIVVLAIIMILAMPSVIGSMTDAQKGTFKIYAEKVLNDAQKKYQTELLLGTGTGKKTYGYCYGLKGADSLDMTSTGSYQGYVVITLDEHLKPTFYVTLTDNNYSITSYTYDKLSAENYTPAKPDTTTITNTCPSSWTKPA